MLPYKSLGELLKSKAKQNHTTYLCWKDAELSFLKLNIISNQIASNFIQAGLQKGDKVALLLENCPEFIFSFFGCAKAGTVAVPIDVRLTQEEIVYILNDSGAKLLVCAFDQMEEIMKLRLKCPALENVYFTDCADTSYTSFDNVYLSSENYPLPQVSGEDLMSIAYTSGTTGKPKGVMLSHANFLATAFAFADAVNLLAEDKMLSDLPLHRVEAQVSVLISPLLRMASLVLLNNFDSYLAHSLQHTIEKFRITLLNVTPALLTALVYSDNDFTYSGNIRVGICLNVSIPVTLSNDFEALFQAPLVEGYGLAEATGICALTPLHEKQKKPYWVGKPLVGLEVSIVDHAGKPLDRGKVGEIILSGQAIAKGYLFDAVLSAQSFIGPVLYTGDMGYLDEDGNLFLLTRKSDIILKGGERILPHIIEEVLYQHPAVKEVAIIGLPEPTWGEEVVAFIVPVEQDTIDLEQIIVYCQEFLSDLKCPGQVKFVNALPKTSSGRVQKAKLREHYGSPVTSS